MLEAMSQLALDFLREQLKADKDRDPWEWYIGVREEQPGLLFEYIVEATWNSTSPNFYVLRDSHTEDGKAVLEQRELTDGTSSKLPFVKSVGPNAGPIGPVIKRTYTPDKGAGPSKNTNHKAIKNFLENSQSGEVWSDYFKQCLNTLNQRRIEFQGKTIDLRDHETVLDFAVENIPERQTALLTILDGKERLPGEVPEYITYLNTVLAEKKYSTKRVLPREEAACSLTDLHVTVYPNALIGAGLDISNTKRVGVFPGLDDQEAWKKFPLSAASADLLYIFSFHVRERFMGQVAGERALLLPYTTLTSPEQRLKFMQRSRDDYVPNVGNSDILARQEKKLERLANEEGVVTSITILWADFGQKLENVRGIVTDVLPSRLKEMSVASKNLHRDSSAPFPEYPIDTDLDIAFNQLGQLLKRPGGKRTEKANSGARLFDLRRDIAANAYHGRNIPTERFWEEIRVISEAYLIDALKSGSFGLIYEGQGKNGKSNYLTMAGWVRHVCKFIYFLRRLEVYPKMDAWRYEPHNERLTEFFVDSDGRTGIDSPEKAYAFLLGALFGKLIQVQARRGVNVGSNALTWLRRLTLSGRDLPELYVRVREKLLTYGTESSANVREVIEELGYLGRTLGMDIRLNQTEAGYFLLLGQSLNRTIMPKTEKTDTEGDA